MQEKYNVTGMTCAACQARVQKSVSNLTGVQECNVNLLKNSIDDVTAMIAGQIGQLLPMDEETAKQFQTLDMIPSSRTLKYKKTYLGVFYVQKK